MSRITNNHEFGLVLAAWLAFDDYTNGAEQFEGESVISATSLIKPTRQFILSQRANEQAKTDGSLAPDVVDRIAIRFGHAIHDSVEHVWTNGYRQALSALGYPAKMIDKIRINPEVIEPDTIPVFLEQRMFRRIQIDNHSIVVSGKVDQILNGELNDVKTTSTFTYMKGTSNDKYQLQGSIYRWIDPVKITSEVMRIQHFFTDWQGFKVKQDPNYPATRIIEKKIELLSEQVTAKWIEAKIREILLNQNLDEAVMIRCSDEDLWKTETVWKYYTDPKKAAEGGRATKNFDSAVAANSYRAKQGKGIVVEVPGEVKACAFCAGFELCSQKDEYHA